MQITYQSSQCAVNGRIQTGSYEAQDGTRRYTTDVVAFRVEFLGSTGASRGPSQGGYRQANQGDYGQGNYPHDDSIIDPPMDDDFTEMSEDDFPF